MGRRVFGGVRMLVVLGVILLSAIAEGATETRADAIALRRAAFVGDGGAAAQARLNFPQGVAVDAQGNIYIADTFNHRIRRVDGRSGVITTFAGTGTMGFSGDGGPAGSAQLATPTALGLDAAGNLNVLDRGNRRIRRIEAGAGTIRTVAGNGDFGFSGDGGPAVAATFNNPRGLAVSPDGTLYIADTGNHRVRRVDGVTGVITTVAGSGVPGFAGDGGPATQAQVNAPQALALDRTGGLYLIDGGNHRIRRVDLATGFIRTVGGSGQPGFSGDGGPATQAQVANPQALAVDAQGNLLVADTFNDRARRIEVGSGTVTTIGGKGTSGLVGDGGPAIQVELVSPTDIDMDAGGNLFIADPSGRVHWVDADNRLITTIAGRGVPTSPPTLGVGQDLPSVVFTFLPPDASARLPGGGPIASELGQVTDRLTGLSGTQVVHHRQTAVSTVHPASGETVPVVPTALEDLPPQASARQASRQPDGRPVVNAEQGTVSITLQQRLTPGGARGPARPHGAPDPLSCEGRHRAVRAVYPDHRRAEPPAQPPLPIQLLPGHGPTRLRIGRGRTGDDHLQRRPPADGYAGPRRDPPASRLPPAGVHAVADTSVALGAREEAAEWGTGKRFGVRGIS